MYFKNCNNLKQLKTEFKKLCLKLHPDKGGEHEIFVQMSNEFQRLLKIYIDRENASNDQYNESWKNFNFETESELSKIIEKLMVFENIDIEVCGSWLWISGETKAIKEQLKALGFKWAKAKKLWYFGFSKGKRRKSISMEKIREKFGSQTLRTEEKLKLV